MRLKKFLGFSFKALFLIGIFFKFNFSDVYAGSEACGGNVCWGTRSVSSYSCGTCSVKGRCVGEGIDCDPNYDYFLNCQAGPIVPSYQYVGPYTCQAGPWAGRSCDPATVPAHCDCQGTWTCMNETLPNPCPAHTYCAYECVYPGGTGCRVNTGFANCNTSDNHCETDDVITLHCTGGDTACDIDEASKLGCCGSTPDPSTPPPEPEECNPTCPFNCGEDDSCPDTGNCSDNGGNPGAFTVSPSGTITLADIDDEVRIDWSGSAGAERYEISLNSEPAINVGSNTFYDLDPTVSSYAYTVTAINTDCEGGSRPVSSAFSIVGGISGQVRTLDPGATTGLGGDGICFLQAGSATGEQPGVGSSVGISGYGSGGVGGGGTYSIGSLPFGTGYIASLTVGDPDNYRCECPSICAYGGISSPQANVDFFMINFEDNWFQVQGGSLHADSGSVTSLIPASCDIDPVCLPYLITEDVDDGSVGVVSYTGNISLGDFTAENIGEGSDDWQADNTSYAGIQTDYDYFYRLLEEVPEEESTIWDGSEPSANGVFLGEEEDQITVGGWNISSGTIAVILVPNDVLIDNNITVVPGGFLAIISSGDVTIADNVTDVQGVYVVDGVINTCQSSQCGDSAGDGDVSGQQLVAEGIFVGWRGIDLRRDFLSSDNDTNPGELFIYRPDLQINAYNYLMKPFYTWREVAP